MFRDSHKCSMCPSKPFSVIDIVVVFTLSIGCITFSSEPRLAVRFLLDFFLGYKSFRARSNSVKDNGCSSVESLFEE